MTNMKKYIITITCLAVIGLFLTHQFVNGQQRLAIDDPPDPIPDPSPNYTQAEIELQAETLQYLNTDLADPRDLVRPVEEEYVEIEPVDGLTEDNFYPTTNKECLDAEYSDERYCIIHFKYMDGDETKKDRVVLEENTTDAEDKVVIQTKINELRATSTQATSITEKNWANQLIDL